MGLMHIHNMLWAPLSVLFCTIMHLACVSSRPGQSGRCDGYILERKELGFYSNQRRQNNDYTLASLHQRNYVFKFLFLF